MLRDDRLLRLTQVTFLPLALLSIVFGPLLYLFPNHTDRYFAWTITPAMSAVFIGAGYISGALVILLMLWLGRWHPMRPFTLGGWGFIVAILAATLLHWDRFHHGTLFFYVWFIVYAAGPFLLPIAYWRNERHNIPPAPAELLLARPLRLGLIAAGAVFTVLGIVLFINPALFIPLWPWELTPLIARVIAAWIFLPALGALGVVYEPRYSAYRPLIRLSIIWALLVLVGSWRYVEAFDFGRPLTWLWFIYLSTIIPVVAVVNLYYERRYARSGPHIIPTGPK